MAPRIKYAVFGTGMLALAAGVSFSLWMLLATGTAGPEAPPLAETLQQTLSLTPKEAASLAGKLQASTAATTPGAEPSLSQALQQALGLTEEQAAALAAQLQEPPEGPAAPEAARPSGGSNEKTSVSDQVDFVVRDAEGKVKQTGSGE